MAEADSEPPIDTGGMAALQVAEAHLSTLLTATDALDGKATFILAVNVALFGVFFGGVISTTDPTAWVALTAPAIVSTLLLVGGAWTVCPRDLSQFVRPEDLLRHRTGTFTSDQLAWSYVNSIADACSSVDDVLNMKARGIGLLALGTVLNVSAIGISAAVWIP